MAAHSDDPGSHATVANFRQRHRRAEATDREIGTPDAYRGQSPKAFLKGHLGKHEMVQELEIRAELPMTHIGKLEEGPSP